MYTRRSKHSGSIFEKDMASIIQIKSFISELYRALEYLFNKSNQLDREIQIKHISYILNQCLFHEKARKILVAFAEATSDRFKSDQHLVNQYTKQIIDKITADLSVIQHNNRNQSSIRNDY